MTARITIKREIVTDDIQEARDNVGVRAVAEIQIPYGKDWITTKINSPGLWGIESDSGEDYFNEVFAEERRTLLDMLEHLKDFTIIE